MVAVRPTFHNPALLAKQAANIDRISNGRLTLNVVSSWWRDEALKYGIPFDEHDDRYARTEEWLDVLTNTWRHQHTTHQGRYYNVEDNLLSPKPYPTRTYSGVEKILSSRPERSAVERPAVPPTIAPLSSIPHPLIPLLSPPSTPAANPKPPRTSSPPSATPTSCTATTPPPSPPK